MRLAEKLDWEGLNTLTFVHKMSVEIIKLDFSSGQWFIRCRGCSFIGLCSTVLATQT